MRMKRRLTYLNILVALIVNSSQVFGQAAAERAAVSGRVFEADGHPLANAKISAFPMDVAISGSLPGMAITDEQGRYELVLPAYPGRTRLGAIKESAGYPDTQGLLFASGKESMPVVTLQPGVRLEGVDIHLGAPDGVLEGLVIDSRTRAPVSRARITLHRDQPDSMYSGSLPADGSFRFALPAVRIDITVTAPGYASWKYKDPQSGATGLVLGSGELRTMTVELKPN
jgi:hypothetical protein